MDCFKRRRRKPEELRCVIRLLDDTDLKLTLKVTDLGSKLLDEVCRYLNLIEKDYFGLRYIDSTKCQHWIDPQKPVFKQLKKNHCNTEVCDLFFGVKFYATDPCKLNEEITRYLFFQQLKKDVVTGRLPVKQDVMVALGSLILQSELGDYDSAIHTPGYVSELTLSPNQTEDLETAISEGHKQLNGYHPSTCETMYLDKIKWLDMYGVDLHLVKGAECTEYYIGLTPSAVVVYRERTKVSIYYWPRISGITFSNKEFYLKVRDKNNAINTYTFNFDNEAACKHLWKCCVEHHSFFRLNQIERENNNRLSGLFHLGSKYRYSGRTEHEVSRQSTDRSPPPVRRTQSQRQERRRSTSHRQLPTKAFIVQSNDSSRSVSKRGAARPSESESDSRAKHKQLALELEKLKEPQIERPDLISHSPPHLNRTDNKLESHHDPAWMKGQSGMFTSGRDSPKSARSVKMMFPGRSGRGDSGSEAGSSLIQRRGQRRESDNESQLSVASRRRRRRYGRGADSAGSDAESIHRRHRSRRSNSIRDSTSICSGISAPRSESALSHARRASHSRRIPKQFPSELLSNIKFGLVETEGLSEQELRNISYTAVRTVSEDIPVPVYRRSKSTNGSAYGGCSHERRRRSGRSSVPRTDSRHQQSIKRTCYQNVSYENSPQTSSPENSTTDSAGNSKSSNHLVEMHNIVDKISCMSATHEKSNGCIHKTKMKVNGNCNGINSMIDTSFVQPKMSSKLSHNDPPHIIRTSDVIVEHKPRHYSPALTIHQFNINGTLSPRLVEANDLHNAFKADALPHGNIASICNGVNMTSVPGQTNGKLEFYDNLKVKQLQKLEIQKAVQSATSPAKPVLKVSRI